ncbi:hypothetical protein [Catellatospora tritici]|uniref:hypothetical protein n=1 Tax=Catellatospora tritici TaxID=2851566 RepID=UPI001C2D835F|nr:hypothetical protein [Catellatospora tritici]MBV1855212.1 hypothetical protein [Catellatospora tritici]
MSDDDLAVWLGDVMDGSVAVPSRAKLESLSHHHDPYVAGMAIVLLGSGGPNPQAASTLLARADHEQVPALSVALYVSGARMDPTAAPVWIARLLDPGAPAVARVAAVAAACEIGLNPTPAMAGALAEAWHPELRDSQVEVCGLRALVRYLSRAVSVDDVLLAHAGSASDIDRLDVARILAERVREGLPDALVALLLRYLDDPDKWIKQVAYQAVATDPVLARRHADRLAADLAAGHPARDSLLETLIKIGDPRWRSYSLPALQQNWHTPSLASALAAQPRDEQLAAAARTTALRLASGPKLAETSPKEWAHRMRHLRRLFDLLDAWGEPISERDMVLPERQAR